MVAPVPTPELQFCDADGNPYAGGTLETYVYGTTTPKETWADHEGLALNTNPIVLDAAGRCLVYGDGEYRIVLRDADGNLVYDQYATTIVSAAMQPVIIAPDLATARRLMGIDDAIAAAVAVETARAEAAEAAISAANTAETARATARETELQNNLAEERNARIASDANLQALIDAGGVSGAFTAQSGVGYCDSGGNFSVTFSSPFPTDLIAFSVRPTDGAAFYMVNQWQDPYGTGVAQNTLPGAADRTHVVGSLGYVGTDTGTNTSRMMPAALFEFSWKATGYAILLAALAHGIGVV